MCWPEAVSALLDAGADPRVVDVDGVSTPLMVASGTRTAQGLGQTSCVELLLAARAEVDDTGGDADADTPLNIAARCGDTHIGVVRALLAAGACVNAADSDGLTPLHGACEDGAHQIVTALIDAGADVDPPGVGWGPLHCAAHAGHCEIVRALVAARAQLHRTDDTGSYGATPLFAACERGQSATVRALLAAGARLEQATHDGRTPLFCAAYHGHSDTLELLIAASGRVNVQTAPEHGIYTPLYAASQNGHAACVAALVDAHANVELAENEQQETPLQAACDHGHAPVVALLLAYGSSTVDPMGVHPMHRACANGHADVVRLLLGPEIVQQADGVGALVDQPGHGGFRPLNVASQLGHATIVRALIEANANVNATTDEGYPPLFHASSHDRFECASALLAAGADVDQVADSGAMPMWIACQSGFLRIVQLLSSYGADRFGQHWNAVDVAQMCENEDVYEWLRMSEHWTTALHHVHANVVDVERARALLRAGADIHAHVTAHHASAPAWGGIGADIKPSPLSLAKLCVASASGDTAEGSAAKLVIQASLPWTPQTHSLFPAWARSRAVSLLRIGYCLFMKEPRFQDGDGTSLYDLWRDRVMGFDVARDRLPTGPTPMDVDVPLE